MTARLLTAVGGGAVDIVAVAKLQLMIGPTRPHLPRVTD